MVVGVGDDIGTSERDWEIIYSMGTKNGLHERRVGRANLNMQRGISFGDANATSYRILFALALEGEGTPRSFPLSFSLYIREEGGCKRRSLLEPSFPFLHKIRIFEAIQSLRSSMVFRLFLSFSSFFCLMYGRRLVLLYYSITYSVYLRKCKLFLHNQGHHARTVDV